VKHLLGITQRHSGMRYRYRIFDEYDAAFERDYRSNEEILADFDMGRSSQSSDVMETIEELGVND
jgi:hypothetical protein